MSDTFLHWDETHLNSPDPADWDLRPEMFSHLDSLYLRCTQTRLPAANQQKLVNIWCDIIPTLNVTSLTLATRTNQKLVNATCQLSNLVNLRIGWGGTKTLDPIKNLHNLTSLEIDSTPSLTGLDTLRSLKNLRKLKIENVKEAQNLRFLSGMETLTDFGICGSMWTDQRVDSLWPVSNLHGLEVLHLIATRVLHDGLAPIHGMPNLKELNASFCYYSASELAALRSATPSLRSGTPFDSSGIETWCKA